jgi:protease-4
MAKKEKSRIGFIIGLLLIIFIIAYLTSNLISIFINKDIQQGNVAIIPIRGIITTERSTGFLDSDLALSGSIVEKIEKAAADPNIKGVIFEINSPGGTPVATDEIATAITELRTLNKTTVSWIREVGASGAYWIATATDHIIANRMSITASIGVYGSYLDFSGLLRKYNVSYQKLTAGKYKDSGVPFRELEEDEEAILQKKLDLLHKEFKDTVKSNRDLTLSETEVVGNGEFYLGLEALNLKLIDELGGKKQAIAYIEKKQEIKAEIIIYEEKRSLLDIFSTMLNENSFFLGKGLGQSMDKAKFSFISQ